MPESESAASKFVVDRRIHFGIVAFVLANVFVEILAQKTRQILLVGNLLDESAHYSPRLVENSVLIPVLIDLLHNQGYPKRSLK